MRPFGLPGSARDEGDQDPTLCDMLIRSDAAMSGIRRALDGEIL